MIRVLLVDDSVVARQVSARALGGARDVGVVGEAADPYAARQRIVELRPDVLVLDVEMPRMDGITFLRVLMQHYPIPVVICSSLTEAGGRLALRALDAGAVEIVLKPKGSEDLKRFGAELVSAVRVAAESRRAEPPRAESRRPESRRPESPAAAKPIVVESATHVELIAIGASTGGTVAVETILMRLSGRIPPIMIVQHMPPYITRAFAERLAKLSRLDVEEARDLQRLRQGLVLVAPGGRHLLVERSGGELRARLKDAPRVNGHCPSVDVLFRSVARAGARRSLGVILTGMGRDGADGLREMHDEGAHTIAQDERSSVVFGMPRAAIELGAADEVVPLAEIAPRMTRALSRQDSSVARIP